MRYVHEGSGVWRRAAASMLNASAIDDVRSAGGIGDERLLNLRVSERN